jgi:uncharacterized membrane protein SirB2
VTPAAEARGIAAIVTANASLAIGTLFYMGWAYTNAWLGYFQINPLDLDIGVTEYALRSLSLFAPALILFGVAAVVLASLPGRLRGLRLAGRVPDTLRDRIPHRVRRIAGWVMGLPDRTSLLLWASGLLLLSVAAGLVLLAAAGLAQPTYLLLLLVVVGSLLLSRPGRSSRLGRIGHSIAIILTAACGLWAAGLYAHNRGVHTAESTVRRLPDQTAIVVYSAQPLALSGLGVSSEKLPTGFRYRYRYQGLRLLIARSDRYYVLPAGWRPGLSATYVLQQSDDLRVELLPGRRH